MLEGGTKREREKKERMGVINSERGLERKTEEKRGRERKVKNKKNKVRERERKKEQEK